MRALFPETKWSGSEVENLHQHTRSVEVKNAWSLLQNYDVFRDKFTLTYKQSVLLTTTSIVTSRNSEVGIMNGVAAELTRVL